MALLIFILWGGMKKEPMWVFGWVYRDLLIRYRRRGEQLDKWQQIAFRGTGALEEIAKDKSTKSEVDQER